MNWLRVAGWAALVAILLPVLALGKVLGYCGRYVSMAAGYVSASLLAPCRWAVFRLAETYIDARTPAADKQRRAKLDRMLGRVRRVRKGVW